MCSYKINFPRKLGVLNMDSITLGQLARGAGIITALWVFREKIIKGVNGALDKKLDPLKKDIMMTMKMQLSTMEHLETGNHQEAMHKLRKEIENYLLERGN